CARARGVYLPFFDYW
nr:immunoglobulin heavy chain junction region [Macaca mulatta]